MVKNMIPANIKIPSTLLLEPTFVSFLEPLALANPHWEFMPVTKGYEDTRSTAYFAKNESGARLEAPVDVKFLYHVKIREGEQSIGHLRMNRKNHSDGGVPNYIVQSWRINKSRGNRNETETTKLNIALRNAKKFLKPRTTNELFDKRVNELKSNFTDATSNLTQSFRYMSRELATDVQMYAYYHITNRDIPSKIKESVTKIMSTTTYEQQIGDYELALGMQELEKAGRLMCIIKTRDDKYMHAPKGTSSPTTTEYDQLPQAWQDKIAVLQLLQDNEMARDIGYRYSSYSFIIIT
jgi:hypothetical protein